MNRPGLLATAVLHGLALWAWGRLGDAHGAHASAAVRPAVAVRLLAAAPPPQHLATTMPLQPWTPTPLLIEAPELPPAPVVHDAVREVTSTAIATSARLPPPDRSAQEPPPVPLPASPLSPPSAPPPSSMADWLPAVLPPDHQACRVQQAERHYPALLRERGIEGRVVVRVRVDEAGHAAEVQVQTASGWRLLDEAARRVAAACPYQAARQGEQRLAAWIEYPIRFSLH